MKGNNRPAIIIIVAVAALILVALVFFNNSEKRHNWNEEYRTQKNEPYDVSLLKELTEQFFQPNEFTKISNLGPEGFLDSLDNSIIIFISDYYRYDSLETVQLFNFVARGNRALIISSFPYNFYSQLGIDNCFKQPEKANSYFNSKTAGLEESFSGSNSSATIEYYLRGQASARSWEYIPDSINCSGLEITSLGTINHNDSSFVNMLEINYGSGSFIINTTPLAFSNFNLRNEEVLEYTEKIYSRLPAGDVYWSEFDFSFFNGGPEVSASPLQFILSQQSLKWAWYLSLLLILLYVIFNSRRKQKLIPLMEVRENNSPNYVDAISRLYKLQGSHCYIIKHQEELLLSFLRDKYKVHTLKLNEEFYLETARKTSVPVDEIKSLFYRFEKMKQNTSLSDENFLKMNSIIQNFYDKCQ